METSIKNNPLISVIMPFYNASEFVEGSLNSILSQDYHNLEVILINDGSTDCSIDIIRKIKG